MLKLFIHGAAGTGKSYFVKQLQEAFNEAKEPDGLVCTSFTGCASQQLPSGSIHSALSIPILGIQNQDRSSKEGRKVKNKDMTILVIDEVSLVTAKMLHVIERELRTTYDITHEQSFGELTSS